MMRVTANQLDGAVDSQWESAEEASTPKEDHDKKTVDCREMG